MQTEHPEPHTTRRSSIAWALVILVIIIGAYAAYHATNTPRETALQIALNDIKDGEDAKMVVDAIRAAHQEIRSNATRWSGVYWTCIFLGAFLSAFASVVLKFESFIKDDKLKKDLAATSAILGALLVSISATGGFETKRHANRVAAADIEALGFRYVATEKAQRNNQLTLMELAAILRVRHQEVVDAQGGRTRENESPKGKNPPDKEAGKK